MKLSTDTYRMTTRHKLIAGAGSMLAIIVMLGMLFGGGVRLSELGIVSDRTLREAAFAAWSVGLPLWFAFEVDIFGPDKKAQAAARADFLEKQSSANRWWAGVAAIVAAILGVTATGSSERATSSQSAAPVSTTSYYSDLQF
jgi:hypothetical protein